LLPGAPPSPVSVKLPVPCSVPCRSSPALRAAMSNCACVPTTRVVPAMS